MLEAPSKALLLELRQERELVAEAHGLLEQQRELIAREIMTTLEQLHDLYEQLQNIFPLARNSIRSAILRHGLDELSTFEFASPLVNPGWRTKRKYGTLLLDAAQAQPQTPPPAIQGGWEISVELEQSNRDFHYLLGILLALAPLQNNIERLIKAFHRTQRKANALENIVRPEMDEQLRQVQDILEELEREDFGRIKFLKRRTFT